VGHGTLFCADEGTNPETAAVHRLSACKYSSMQQDWKKTMRCVSANRLWHWQKKKVTSNYNITIQIMKSRNCFTDWQRQGEEISGCLSPGV